jgi:hypothetical protein
MGDGAGEITDLFPVQASPRHLQAIELVTDSSDDASGRAALPEGGTAANQ